MRINRKEVTIVTHCPFCHKVNIVSTNEIDWFAWECGSNAQDTFPYLSAAEREMVTSGICPTCWDQLIGEEEEKQDSSNRARAKTNKHSIKKVLDKVIDVCYNNIIIKRERKEKKI